MRSVGNSLFFLMILLLVDFYVFHVLKAVSANWSGRSKAVVYTLYWLFCSIGILFLATMPYVKPDFWPQAIRPYLFATTLIFFLSQLVSLPFFLIDDLRRLGVWVMRMINAQPETLSTVKPASEAISRSIFLSWLGLGLGGGLLTTMLYGYKNKYNYQVKKVKLSFANLPAAFKGFKLVHISDIHSGSFTDKAAVLHGVQLINKQQADLILFTGDLVNDKASEMEPYLDVFNQLSAPMGVFSTFGNHDYGDYARWNSEEEKWQNQQQLRQVHARLGWKLLWDEHVTLQKGDDKIGLIGVQNISGKGNFHSYGSLQKAAGGMEQVPFKILMSHDPSHWEAEVIPAFADIDLTLSGHTHGMQFGVEVPGLKWSPVQWMYKQWAGLYENNHQKLYVNRGFGFIGYPGRVGILPEITVIELA